jgi:flap endonuclease-1
VEAELSEDEEQVLVEEQDPTEDVEIKRALVEPDESYTESLRQMALTAEEELQLQDLAQAAASGVDAPTRIREIAKDVNDLQDRARLVAKTYARGHSLPAKWEMEEIQQLMHVMGVPVILAHPPFEAEGLASAMALAGTVDFVGTEDTDVLGYEAPLLRNIASGSKPIEIIQGKDVRSAYGLTRGQYIDFLILSGTDASSRIPRIGPSKALKLIREFGNIEAILENDEQLRKRVALDYHEEVEAARKVFNDLPPLPSAEEVEPRKVEDAVVRDYMKTVHGVLLPASSSNEKGIGQALPQNQDQIEQEARLALEVFRQQSMDEID